MERAAPFPLFVDNAKRITVGRRKCGAGDILIKDLLFIARTFQDLLHIPELKLMLHHILLGF